VIGAAESWTRSVLCGVRALRIRDFTGLGLVFYTERAVLPVYPLVPNDQLPSLPASSLQECIDLVADIARTTSPCHDGFLLVRADALALTDVSQFLSPPLPSMPLAHGAVGGARQMAARLTSLVVAAPLTGVCTSNFEVTLYERGLARSLHL
jgi:hypothetical protein